MLNIQWAIEVNIRIKRVFTRMREVLLQYKDVLLILEQIERQTSGQQSDIQLVFETIRYLIAQPKPNSLRKRAGYHSVKETPSRHL
ncbi:MAG: hypothetical protein LW707_03675 [Sphingobacteriales bacterium]|jgi:hypothetical protein|nr:hypothetical protein [Sphingobacteriales bacterium]